MTVETLSATTILVVDDSERVRGVVTEILRAAGFLVREAATGIDALRAAAERPDLIVLDVQLPDLDGLEVCRRLKADRATVAIPILHLSGHFRALGDRVRALEIGADGYLEQPVDATELVATVRALLRLRRVEAELRESEERRRVAEGLLEITQAVTSTLERGEILRVVAQRTARVLGAERCGINLWRDGHLGPATTQFADGRSDHAPWSAADAGDPSRLDEVPAHAEAIRTRRPVVIADAAASPLIPRSWVEVLACRAALVVPLVHQERVIGTMIVDRTDGPYAWQQTQVDLATTIATEAALALEKARLFEEIERRRLEAESLAAVGRLVSQSLDPADVPQRIADSVRALFGAEASCLYRLEPESDDLHAVAVASVIGPVFGRDLVLPQGTGVAGLAVRDRAPIITTEVLVDRGTDFPEELRARIDAAPYRAVLGVPLQAQERVTGALVVVDRAERAFSENEVGLAQAFADHAAVALENARLLEETRERLRETETLLAVGQLLSVDLPTHEAMRRVARETARAFHADMVGAYFLDAKREVLRPLAGYRVPKSLLQWFLETPFPVASLPFVRDALETGRPVWSPDATRDPRLALALVASVQPHAVVFAPTRVRGEAVGGLFLIWWTPGRHLDRGEVRLVEGIAAQVGLALERRQAEEVRADLENQLRHAQKMEAVGRLAGGVAHDFNNLLTVISGRGQLLLQHLGPEDPGRRHVELIQQTADRATALTRQLLAFSRKQVLEPKLLDLNAVVAGLEPMLQRLIGEHIELATRLEAGAGRVEADPGQLEQVILNLAVNARDAMPDGGRLTIETAVVTLDHAFAGRHPGVRPGRYARLAVVDTGVGMDAETRAHIFEPFFTTKEKGKGTGLGLAMVYGVVKQSGGLVTVTSEPGQGATFAIYLPEAASRSESNDVPGPARAAHLPRGTETILLVEDDVAVRDLAREILQMLGYTVLGARRPTDALDVAARHLGPIHLLMTDVVLPQMSGHELADRLVAHRPETRVLYMSGYADDALGHQGAADGRGVLLSKPFTPEALARRLREVLDA